jgi:hypothetical protein
MDETMLTVRSNGMLEKEMFSCELAFIPVFLVKNLEPLKMDD